MTDATAGQGESDAPRLVAVCGLPGVGKTTVAEDVAGRLDATLLRTDVVRKDLLDDPQYTDEETERVYDELFRRARVLLEDGDRVVLDATFQNAAFRTHAKAMAEAVGVPFTLVHVVCDEDVAEARIRARTDDESDADVEVYRMFRELFDPLAMDHVTVDNSDGLDATRRRVAELF